MLKHKLVHAFVPHEHNNFRPHAFRHKWLSLYSIGLIVSHFAFGVAFYTGPINASESLLSKNIIDLTNESRTKQGLPVLSENDVLTKAAYGKLNDMFQKDYWDHRGPDGTEAWYFIENEGYKYSFAGENLAKGFRGPQSVFNAWMGSPTHRSNILDIKHKDIGVAVGTGKLGGKKTTVIVQLFGAKKAYAGEPAKNLTLGQKITKPQVSLANAASPVQVPYLAVWGVILTLIMIDYIMLRKTGAHKHKIHKFHLTASFALSLFFFVMLIVGVASIA